MAKHLGALRIRLCSAGFRRARIVLGSALVAASAILAAGWPAQTYAEGLYETIDQQQAEQDELFSSNATELGSLLAVTRLVPDDKQPGRYYLEILVRNKTGEGEESAQVEATLERTAYSPMDRGSPPPTVAWRTKQLFHVPAGQTVAKRVAIPQGLGWKISQSKKPPAANTNGIPTGPVIEYATNIAQLVPPPADAPAPVLPQGGGAKALAAPVAG
jgi:hypothetical protein